MLDRPILIVQLLSYAKQQPNVQSLHGADPLTDGLGPVMNWIWSGRQHNDIAGLLTHDYVFSIVYSLSSNSCCLMTIIYTSMTIDMMM